MKKIAMKEYENNYQKKKPNKKTKDETKPK